MTISDKLTLLEQTKEAQRIKLGLPKSIPFNQYVKFIRDPFTFTELFKNGEQGILLDLSDLKTMFQDVNGIEPVTKDGSPVGLFLDKSQGLALDTPLISTNSVDFETSLWGYLGVNYLAKGNTFTVYSGTAGPRLNGLVSGKAYKIVATISHPQDLTIRNGGGGSAPIIAQYPSSNRRTVDTVFVASLTSIYFRITGEGDFIIHDITVAEIKGNHATQPTASARPIYKTGGTLQWLEFDGVDDTLSVQIPTGTYTEVKASRDGVTHKYPVNVSGAYNLGSLTQTKQSVSGLVLVNRQLTQVEIENVTNLMKAKAGLPL